MKKICAILIALVLLIVPMTISVSAAGDINANEQKVITALSEKVTIDGKTFKVPKEYITQASNYFKTIDMTEAQATEILGYIKEGKEIIVDQKITGTTNLDTFAAATKQEILELGKKAAAATGATLTFDGEKVVVKNAAGQEVFNAAAIVKQTGIEVDFTSIAIIVSSVVALLAFSLVVAKKSGLFVK